jgi:hypothetical protein
MRRLALTLTSVLSLSAISMAGPYDGQYASYKTITVTPTVTGGNLDNQSNFPLSVRFYKTADNNTARGAEVINGSLNSGLDVRFTNEDGTVPLAFERESWIAGNSAAFWVRIPTMNGTSGGAGVPTIIRVYYGKVDANDTSSSTAVFDTAAGFRAVYHMNGATSTSDDLDATQNGLHATVMGAPATSTAGIPPCVGGFARNGTRRNASGAGATIRAD